MKIGEVAAYAGVNVQTIRFYERRGMLPMPARLASGYRIYPANIVKLIQFIKQSQELGYTLDEIKQLLLVRSNRNKGNAQGVRSLAEAKIKSIEARINRLKRMRRELKRILQKCRCGDETLTNCPVLETLEYDSANKERNICCD
jgi:Hg(II)-responsive transcriptional regulator